jgi:alpha-mannosidase
MPREPGDPVAIEENSIESPSYQLSLDPLSGGIRRAIDLGTGRDIVDPAPGYALNEQVYEWLDPPAGRNLLGEDESKRAPPLKRDRVTGVRITPGESGPVRWSLRASGESEPFEIVESEYFLYRDLPRFDIVNRVVKPINTDPEAVYRAFPLQPRRGKVLLDIAGGVIDPAGDALEGSASSWHAIQDWFAASGDRFTVTVASPDVPLVMVGGFHAGEYGTRVEYESPFVLSWVMNNYWPMNFRAGQGGEFRWRYSIASGEDRGPARSERFARERATPLRAVAVIPETDGDLPPAGAFCRVEPGGVIPVATRPARHGEGVILLLHEMEGERTNAWLEFPALESIRAYETNVLEEDIRWLRAERNTVEVPIGPLGYTIVRIVPEGE